jgi:hypothetical protein
MGKKHHMKSCLTYPMLCAISRNVNEKKEKESKCSL